MENEQISTGITKCYLSGCDKPPYPGSYWCSRTHQLLEQQERYGRTSTHKVPLEIQDIQEKLKKMASDMRNRKKTKTPGDNRA